MAVLVKNNAFSTLASGITDVATSITLAAGTGSRFPAAGGADYFYATLINTSNELEVVKVTARSTDTLTVVRAQDGTTARAYSTSDRIELRVTAALIQDIRDSITPADGTVTTAKIVNDNVTYAKIQNVSTTSRILGRKSVGVGDVEEVTLSEVLDFIGSAAQGDILYRGASAWARLAAGSSGQVLKSNGAGANPSWQDVIVQGTAQTFAAAGNTFTGIPTTAKKIIVSVDALASPTTVRFRLGTSSGIVTTGYNSSGSWFQNDSGGGGDGSTTTSTTSMLIYALATTQPISGTIILTNLTGNTWVCSHMFGGSSISRTFFGGGSITLPGALDRVSLTPNSGSLLASGSANIMYM